MQFLTKILIVLAPVCILGCKNSSNAIPVHGKVTYRGDALTNAGITFFPTTGRPVAAAAPQGEYSTELPLGDYTVVVNIGSELPSGYKEGDPIPPPKILLPTTYTTRAKSTLKAVVKPGQSDPIDFDLK